MKNGFAEQQNYLYLLKFNVMEDGNATQELIRTIRSVAEYYKMHVLKSTLDWVIGSSGIVLFNLLCINALSTLRITIKVEQLYLICF